MSSSPLLCPCLLAANTVTNWNYGNLIYDMHSLLGRIALRDGDVAAAQRHLAESGKSPGSPQLNSFGPDFVLARELLEKGEREAVLGHRDLVTAFWGSSRPNSREGGERPNPIETWKAAIRAGQIPDDHQWRTAHACMVDTTPVDAAAVRNARRQMCVNQLQVIEGAKELSIVAEVPAPLTLPSPRAGEDEAVESRGERDEGGGGLARTLCKDLCKDLYDAVSL